MGCRISCFSIRPGRAGAALWEVGPEALTEVLLVFLGDQPYGSLMFKVLGFWGSTLWVNVGQLKARPREIGLGLGGRKPYILPKYSGCYIATIVGLKNSGV